MDKLHKAVNNLYDRVPGSPLCRATAEGGVYTCHPAATPDIYINHF